MQWNNEDIRSIFSVYIFFCSHLLHFFGLVFWFILLRNEKWEKCSYRSFITSARFKNKQSKHCEKLNLFGEKFVKKARYIFI